MYHATANRAPVADLWVGDLGHRLRQQRGQLRRQGAALHLRLPRHRPQAQPARRRARDAGQFRHAVQVNEDGRL